MTTLACMLQIYLLPWGTSEAPALGDPRAQEPGQAATASGSPLLFAPSLFHLCVTVQNVILPAVARDAGLETSKKGGMDCVAP